MKVVVTDCSAVQCAECPQTCTYTDGAGCCGTCDCDSASDEGDAPPAESGAAAALLVGSHGARGAAFRSAAPQVRAAVRLGSPTGAWGAAGLPVAVACVGYRV